jgi:hypothetical protein
MENIHAIQTKRQSALDVLERERLECEAYRDSDDEDDRADGAGRAASSSSAASSSISALIANNDDVNQVRRALGQQIDALNVPLPRLIHASLRELVCCSPSVSGNAQQQWQWL